MPQVLLGLGLLFKLEQGLDSHVAGGGIGTAANHRQAVAADFDHGTRGRLLQWRALSHSQPLPEQVGDKLLESAPLNDGTQFHFPYDLIG